MEHVLQGQRGAAADRQRRPVSGALGSGAGPGTVGEFPSPVLSGPRPQVGVGGTGGSSSRWVQAPAMSACEWGWQARRVPDALSSLPQWHWRPRRVWVHLTVPGADTEALLYGRLHAKLRVEHGVDRHGPS